MHVSLKTLLEQGNKGSCYFLRGQVTYNNAEILDIYEDEIRKQISNSSNARWDLAFIIARLVRSGAWAAYSSQTIALCDKYDKDHPGCKWSDNPYNPIGGSWIGTNSIYLLTFLREKFGLCRTTVYTYLEVVDEFATYIDDEDDKEPEYRINLEAQSFQFWQLIEMTSLTYQERLKVQPNWTREEIRAYKKSLREKNKGSVQPAELAEAEEKPMTEAQQRFANYSKDDLIDLVVKLEKTCEESKTTFEQVLADVKQKQVTIKNILPLKHELTGLIEKHLKAFNYEIHLNGRKQGVKAFSGVLAKVILESCNSDNEAPSLVDKVDEDPIQQKFAV